MEDGERLLHHLRLSLHHDQIQRSLNDILVGAFNCALVDGGVLLQCRPDSCRGDYTGWLLPA